MVNAQLKHILFIAFCFFIGIVSSQASESARYASRAMQKLRAGHFAVSYKTYEKALLFSRKESDLVAEARILLSMAEIRIASLDLDLADSLLAQIRWNVLDEATRVAVTTASISLCNARGNGETALQKANSVTEEDLDEVSDESRAAYFAELAIAYALKGEAARADEFTDYVRQELSKKDGRYIYTQARVAAGLRSWHQADSLFRIAEQKSIHANRIYRTASILFQRSEVSEQLGKLQEAKDFATRSAHAFELMGLPNLQKRSTEKFEKLKSKK